MRRILIFFGFCIAIAVLVGCSYEPRTAEEIVEQAYEKHGGKVLTDWETMVCKGEVYQIWGLDTLHGEYVSYAQKPGKIRYDRDFTKFKHSPAFYVDVYNEGNGWRMVNLNIYTNRTVVGMNKRQFDACEGIAYYLNHADTLIHQLDGVAAYVLDGDTTRIPARVVTAVVGEDTTTLYFDKKRHYFIQEEFRMGASPLFRKVFTDFKKFGSVFLPGKRIEFEPGGMALQGIRYLITSVEYDVPIDSTLFQEFGPASN
ncbi:MAG: hypothetical protein ABIL68_03155 [bacterium]